MNSTGPDGIQTIEHKNIRKPPGTSIMICSAAISVWLYRIINEAEQSAFQVSLAAKQQSLNRRFRVCVINLNAGT